MPFFIFLFKHKYSHIWVYQKLVRFYRFLKFISYTHPKTIDESTLLLFTPLEFFTSVLADGFSLEFEWQQVSSSLQDSSQYSGRS